MISLLVSVICVMVVGGIFYYLAVHLPLDEPFKKIVIIAVILIIMIWLLATFGVLGRPWRLPLDVR